MVRQKAKKKGLQPDTDLQALKPISACNRFNEG
jgi:hypothetical protein